MNPGITTLEAVRIAAQQRADMLNSNFLSKAEWDNNINASYFELYGLLVQKYGNDYFVAIDANGGFYQFTTNGTSEIYPLPDGSSTYLMPAGTTAPAFFKLLGVELQVSGANDWMTLKPFEFIERNRFAVPNMQSALGRRTNLRYRIISGQLWLKPVPMGGQVVRIQYVPRMTILVADDDTFDGVNGWEEYIVIDAAIKALQKEESDVSALMAQKTAIIQRIEAEAENRDAGSPARVGNSRNVNGWGYSDFDEMT